MLDGLSSLAALGAAKKKKPEPPKPPVTFDVKAPSMLPTWLPWALGVLGAGVVVYLFVRKKQKAAAELR